MRSSQESLDWYKKINDLWQANNFPIRFRSRQEMAEKVDFNIAKQVWRKAFKQEYREFKGKLIFGETSGNRYTTSEKNFNDLLVWINTSKGWSDLVHDLGHTIHYFKYRCSTNERPHNANHATIEWRITQLVFDGGYIDKSRKALQIHAQRSLMKKNVIHTNFTKIFKRIQNLEKRKKQYETNLKTIDTKLKALNKKFMDYKRKYSDHELSATHVKKTLKPRKPYKSAKQHCLGLAEQYSYLNVWKEDVQISEGETRILVWRNDQEYQNELDLEYGNFIDNWSEARCKAVRLVDQYEKILKRKGEK